MVGSTIFTSVVVFSGASIMAHLRQHFHKRVNFFLRVHLGYRDQHLIRKRWIILTEIVSADDAMLKQMRIDLRCRRRALQSEFMEEGFIMCDVIALDLNQLFRGIMRLLITKFGNLTKTFFAKQRKIDRCAECDQTLIGADVGRGTFAFDVLFAR